MGKEDSNTKVVVVKAEGRSGLSLLRKAAMIERIKIRTTDKKSLLKETITAAAMLSSFSLKEKNDRRLYRLLRQLMVGVFFDHRKDPKSVETEEYRISFNRKLLELISIFRINVNRSFQKMCFCHGLAAYDDNLKDLFPDSSIEVIDAKQFALLQILKDENIFDIQMSLNLHSPFKDIMECVLKDLERILKK